jgi:DNA repair exonuclease SbcCD ATPase subunit
MAKTATLAVARSETKLEAAKLRFRSDRLGQLAVEDNRISANMAVLQHQHEKLAKLAGKKSGTLCPTCGSPISGDPDAERKAIETQMTLMNRELTSMREEAKELQRAQAAINLLATEVSQAQASAVAAGELVKRLESVRPGSFAGDEALLRQQRLQATTTIGKYQQLVLVCNQLDNAMAAASSKRDAVLQQLATTSAEFQAVAHITKESYEKASAICSQQAKLEGDIRVLRRDLELRLEQLVEADRLVKEAEAKQLEAATVEMAANNLQQLRAVFHRDAAPAIFARDSLLALSEDINVNLEEAEADFRVASVDGIETKNPLSFRLIFPSGVETTAKRLSGGQKVLLAICFRLSLQRQFGHNLGLLCMDEPTAGLNQANVDRVGKLFSKIRSASSTEGLQLIFVTHDVSLSRFCDQVIDLATG